VARRDLRWLPWRGNGPAFDSEILLPGRLEKSLTDYGIDDARIIKRFSAAVDGITSGGGAAPVPHVCCLVADGDRMGAALGELTDPDSHREFSKRLAGFAGRAREIVNEQGFTVYAGGDDVLGFVSPAASLMIAERLREAFERAVGEIDGISRKPTLSVGLGIGHVFDGMAHLLELGRQAERVAKGDGETEQRDALGIIINRRSGGTTSFRGRWQTDPAGRILELAGLIDRGRLPMGKIHELKRMLQRLPEPGRVGADAAGFARVLAGEVGRILARSGGDTGGGDESGPKLSPGIVHLDIATAADAGDYATCHRGVQGWVNACLVAREFRGVTRREENDDG
jgi:CRISPR-associated protein Cmr2